MSLTSLNIQAELSIPRVLVVYVGCNPLSGVHSCGRPGKACNQCRRLGVVWQPPLRMATYTCQPETTTLSLEMKEGALHRARKREIRK